jgi:uncharacterized protein YecE (DUF72 family)
MDLFDDEPAIEPPAATARARQKKEVGAAACSAEVRQLAARMPGSVRLGTSSWSFPGWKGLVWDGDYSETQLSKQGIGAYAAHPLLQTVSLDRSFYRPLSASQYAAHAAAVPGHFRFVVKAPSLVTDSLVRGDDGRAMQPNPAFLDPQLAASEFIQPVLEGLGEKAGALVFQLGPLPANWLARMPELLARLAAMLAALPALRPAAPDAVVAVEVRNVQFLTPEFAAVLKAAGATYCLGLHAKMPPIEAQLPLLRALWPAPLVCRWNLHRKHGAYGYEEAKGLYEPFDRLVDPDPETRDVLARVIAATAAAGFNAFVTINNKAEGSAPLSILELAKAVLAQENTALKPA